ncbi:MULTISPECIES: hypothetical protein [unclassified Caulobacter]|jgi:hypothetical protein|uniref:hypothetical protein n=1 Tax=unclassified Caulobacter TaxID=2648921 RepID=UPI0006FE5811|nr:MULTISPECIES: hypothetical protein [unclassified Caulobacter]KQV56591.1 hypothetical protein ASC62_09690 [Caulobacter sp. Root342]KQV72228.1 hypothetical protein ASC70_00640 [Caulobacter sp. Root343]
MRRALILAAVLAAAATPALAEKTAPANKVLSYLDKYLKIPPGERTRVRVAYAIRHDDKPIPNLKVTLVEKNGVRTPLPVNANGFFERLPSLAQLQGDPDLVFDVPADWKMGTVLDIQTQLKPATEYDVRDLTATVDEGNAVVGKAAGVASFMVPKMSGIAFLKAESGVVVFADGRTAPLPLAKEMPYFRPADHQGAVRVKLTKTPTRVAFYQGKK